MRYKKRTSPFGRRPFDSAVVLILVAVLVVILVLAAVLILIVVLILAAVLIVILVAHNLIPPDSFLR